ncbi:MAG: serine hydrolase domain-containing protein [Acidimicrobiales bacterium]
MKIDADGAGLSATRLARIDEHLTRAYLEPGKIAGCQVAVVRKGALAHFSSLGLMDRERNKPVDEGTIWRIYSMTKPITGVALMTLYERGLFQLGDPVSRFIPEWRNLKVGERQGDGSVTLVDPQRPMTIKDLMMHMSGLGYGPGNNDLDTDAIGIEKAKDAIRPDRDLAEMCTRMAGDPLRFHPGTRWLYSLSIDVMGRLVEILSGKAFDEFLRTELFEPLGMVDTAFFVPDDKIDRFSACYARNSRKELKLTDDPERSMYRTPPTMFSGGGGLVSTMNDYLRFARMLVNGGELDGHRILSRNTVKLMGTNHLPGGGQLRDFALEGSYGEVGFDGMGFGLSMSVSAGPVATQLVGSPGEFMWGGAASTIFWVDPVEDLTVVFMTQLLPSGTFNFRDQIKTIVHGAIED